jgi:putative chitinase
MAKGDALKALQSKCGVTPDGAFGPNTARAIAAHFKLDAKRGAHFLGQVAHESMNFLISKESLFYSSADRIQKIWPTRFKNVDAAKPYTKNPKKLGNFVYGDRMGNAPNEGHKYLGRGFIQLTGKKNVTEFAHHIGRDSLIDDPKPIEDELAMDSAIFFFEKNGLFLIADKGVTEEIIKNITKRVNGGYHGLEDRIEKTMKIHRWLST